MAPAMKAALTELSDKIRNNERIDESSDEYRWWSLLQIEPSITEYAVARKHNVVLLQKHSSKEGLAYPLDISNTAENPSLYVPNKAVHKSHPKFLLRGIPLPRGDRISHIEGASDKTATLRVDGPLWVSGTYQYVSNRGADLAVPVLQPLDPAALSA
jgi:hypothetical protein